MSKILELAREAGMGGDGFGWLASDHAIQKFYTLVRADLEAENAKLRFALEDILFHVEEAMRNEVQPYEVEMAAKRARAVLGETK